MSSVGIKGYTGHRPAAVATSYSYEPGTSMGGREKRYMQLFASIRRQPVLAGELSDRKSMQQTDSAGLKPDDFVPNEADKTV